MDSASYGSNNRKPDQPLCAVGRIDIKKLGLSELTFVQNQPQDAPWNAFDNMNDDEEGLDIWGFLNRRKAFVILLSMVGAGLGYLYFQKQIPRYSSSSLLQVIHHNSDPRVENMMAERNLSDAQFVVSSRKLLEPCIRNNNLGELETLRGLAIDDAILRIGGMVQALPAKGAANILHIVCEGPNASDTAAIANAIAAEFINHQERSYENAVTKLQLLLTQAKDELSDSLEKLEQDYADFDKTSPLQSDGKNLHQARLADIQRKISALVIRRTEVKAELRGLELALRNGSPKEVLMMVIGQQAQDDDSVEKPEAVEEVVNNAQLMFQRLMPLLMEEALLSEEYGPGHPKLQGIRQRIEITRNQFQQLLDMEPEKSPQIAAPQKEKIDFLAVYMDSLRQELLFANGTESELESLASKEEAAAKSLRDFEHSRKNFERRIGRETSTLEGVQEQLRDTQLPTNLGGVSASVLTAARHGSLVYPKLSQFLGMGAFLGAFLGLGLGYLVEVADRSFRKPEEIIREFGIPIVGHIPYMTEQKLRKIPKDTKIDRTIISLHLPRSRPAEAYRSVRTAVCFSAIGSDHRVIQVTSPAAGDGKSTLTMNFAVSLAQSGKKTIIIESDFRRPKVHKLTGVSNKVGVVDVLRGDAEVTDAIQETELEGFYVMSCGSRPRNPSELITRPEYEELLQVLREKFEYVIIDTPPVLVVTDPCSVAPRVDGVLLCVRLSKHTREFGRRALEQLRDVGANMTGIVINGIEETDAYGYGNYNYSDYRYRYKDYNYNYGYEDKADEAYFAESES